MVSFFEIEMLGNLSDQYSRMARKASKKMQENMQIIAESLSHVKQVLINDDCMNEFNEHKAKIEEALSRVNVSIDVIGGLLGICLEH